MDHPLKEYSWGEITMVTEIESEVTTGHEIESEVGLSINVETFLVS